MAPIAENIAQVRRRIHLAAVRAGRDPMAITLVAVTKTVTGAAAMEAVRAGVPDLGESRVQEARRKSGQMGLGARWHLIGPLQMNKAKYCPGFFALIHSVDRLELFRELSRRAAAMGEAADCLLQVNLSGETQKSGCRREDAEYIIKEAAMLGGVRIKGLMTIPPHSGDPEDSRPFFRELYSLAHELDGLGVENMEMSVISAGMTGDFEVAVEEGSTMVRIGSAIFGAREPLQTGK